MPPKSNFLVQFPSFRGCWRQAFEEGDQVSPKDIGPMWARASSWNRIAAREMAPMSLPSIRHRMVVMQMRGYIRMFDNLHL
ncbi:hypothetical protein BDZ89DRAFT_1142688 [Hymenopellis radicata]|nr:hypothetical protein BDZ89DRAFT_1142688 [Hymenopellis radicata]